MSNFSRKRIDVEFNLANGQFEGGGNTVKISGLRVIAQINYMGGPGQAFAEAAIYGIPLSRMNQLSTVGNQLNAQADNNMAIYAYNEGEEPAVVFQGTLFNAFVDAQAMPQVNFHVSGNPGPYQANKPAEPLSIKGSADAAQMMQKLAGQMGLQFENNGVQVKLSNPYYGGTFWTQALGIARAGNFDLFYENKTMIISPRNKPREGQTVKLSRTTGMIGYPMFNQAQVIVRSIFNPNFKMGGLVEIESDLTSANGQRKIASVLHELESETPKGKWQTTLQLVNPGTN